MFVYFSSSSLFCSLVCGLARVGTVGSLFDSFVLVHTDPTRYATSDQALVLLMSETSLESHCKFVNFIRMSVKVGE